MKKFFVFMIASLCFINIFGQDYVPTPADIEHFYKTKTLIVREANPICEYNLVIKDVISKEWKITPYDFIDQKEFEEKRMDPQYSFIYFNQVRFDLDETKAVFNFISLLIGGKEKVVAKMPDLCSVPVSYRGVDEDSYSYKLATLFRFMQNHVELITKNPKMISRNIFKHYNDNMGDVYNKTFYILQSELAKDCNTEAKIKAIYPFKFKIATKEEISKAIDSRDSTVVFLHKVGPEGTKFRSRCYKIVIGAADSKFYYFDFHKIDNEKNKPDGFMAEDFKDIAKQAKKKQKK